MSFLGPKIWNKVSSKIKAAATTSFTHRVNYKEISYGGKAFFSKLQELAILLIFIIIIIIIIIIITIIIIIIIIIIMLLFLIF